jgi:hypothetical protein
MVEYNFYIPNTGVSNIAAHAGAHGATHPLQLPSKYKPGLLFPFPPAKLLGKTPVRAGHLASSFSLVRTFSLNFKGNKKDYGG